MSIIKLKPIYQERVWGGTGFATLMNRPLPDGKIIGESWEIVDREEAQSMITEGPFEGKTFREVLETESSNILPPNADPKRPFPILVKWLDCQDRLSLQVHPPASIAGSLNGEPKTENWYIADAKPDASLIVGLPKETNREKFESALKANQLEDCCHRFPVKAGDSILVESGRMHAIDAGNLILEIQQNSDTTYRVYDWGRVGLDGEPRQLHIEESLKSIDFDDFEPSAMKTAESSGELELADCSEFRIRKFALKKGEIQNFTAHEDVKILSVVTGSIEDSENSISAGENVILPYCEEFSFTVKEDTTFLVTDHFYN